MELKKYIFTFYKLLYFSLFFTLQSFAENQCQQSFSVIEAEELIKPSVVGENLVRNAEIKLEQDLEKIKNSPEERLLETQGFKRSYYAGVDQAREFNRVGEHLREIKADPKHTHIPYFADQIEKNDF